MAKPKIVTISKAQIDERLVNDLVSLLEKITNDGEVTTLEVDELVGFLNEHRLDDDVPAFFFLREVLIEILGDGELEDHEIERLHQAILRVLPKDKRDAAKNARSEVMDARRKARALSRDLATPRQIDYIANLGGIAEPGLTKRDASLRIDSLLLQRPTPRQRMVLRFWNRMDLAPTGVSGISIWMDAWYSENPLRIEAWSLWKKEFGDSGGWDASTVESVPIGIGDQYLERVKVAPKKQAAIAGKGCLFLIATFALPVVSGAVWLIAKSGF